MRSFFVFLVFFMASFPSRAQQKHFISIQSDNRSIFYIQSGEREFASSSTGYAIVSGLQQGRVMFEIVLQNTEETRLMFSMDVQEDASYRLKYLKDEGWRLIHLRTNEIVSPKNDSDSINSTHLEVDHFTSMLAEVVDAPELKFSTIDKKNKFILPDTLQLLSSVLTENVRKMAFIERLDGREDTLILQLEYKPLSDSADMAQVDGKKSGKKNKQQRRAELKKQAHSEISGNFTVEEVQDLSRILQMDKLNDTTIHRTDSLGIVQAIEVKKEVSEILLDSIDKKSEKKLEVGKSGCRAIAVYEDFFQLRKKMAATETDELMLRQAEKTLKKKCFNTNQIYHLCFLFLKEKDRMRFFELAYPLVHDPEEYGKLEPMLTDPSMLLRFRKMTGK